jgi:hypothetical protein
LWEACLEYFHWVKTHPLYEERGFAFKGDVTKENFAKMRPLTIHGLCNFLCVDKITWASWRDDDNPLSCVVKRVDTIIYQQKFDGAAADLLNPNIIARDLGLADKSELTGANGGPIKVQRTDDDIVETIESKLALIAEQGQTKAVSEEPDS